MQDESVLEKLTLIPAGREKDPAPQTSKHYSGFENTIVKIL